MSDMTPFVEDIKRTRGDTFPFDIYIKLNGSVIDISGYTFLLTVHKSQAPDAGGSEEFQISPAIQDGPNGVIRVTLLPAEADIAPRRYYYDLQMTNGASIRTVGKGAWIVEQDITK